MAPARPAEVPPPSAHRRRAADGTASYGSMMYGGPGSPKAVMPQVAHVDGMNCMGPSAPALDGPMLLPSQLSIWPMAASTVQDSRRQYRAADCWTNGR